MADGKARTMEVAQMGEAVNVIDTTERLAHQLLRLVGDRPGQHGRLRSARIVASYPVPAYALDAEHVAELEAYAVPGLDWVLKDVVALIDALISGGLITQTQGTRPTLVLTRSGHRALDALDAPPAETWDVSDTLNGPRRVDA